MSVCSLDHKYDQQNDQKESDYRACDHRNNKYAIIILLLLSGTSSHSLPGSGGTHRLRARIAHQWLVFFRWIRRLSIPIILIPIIKPRSPPHPRIVNLFSFSPFSLSLYLSQSPLLINYKLTVPRFSLLILGPADELLFLLVVAHAHAMDSLVLVPVQLGPSAVADR